LRKGESMNSFGARGLKEIRNFGQEEQVSAKNSTQRNVTQGREEKRNVAEVSLGELLRREKLRESKVKVKTKERRFTGKKNNGG